MELTNERLAQLTETYGDAFYLLDSAQFKKNYIELKEAFAALYPNTNIAYSYKTNYTPKLCKIVKELGGFAEVVSEMEMEIAFRIGVSPNKIIWNGPVKNAKKAQELLLLGGVVNLDSIYEVDFIRELSHKYPSNILNIGIRCNFDINDGVISRFGFDVESQEFREVLKFVKETKNVHFVGLQCHFATRRLETWKSRTEGMLGLISEIGIIPERIDLGGGLFGKMPDSLKKQFDSAIPTYTDYAEVVAPLFAEAFESCEVKPELLIEPGSALVGDCMDFAARVATIKTVRGKSIASVLGSVYNINPTLNRKNPPLTMYHLGGKQQYYSDLDFGGFTCIESDYLYRNYQGEVGVGDMAVFGNVGSYSIVLKPPFILPNFPVIDISDGETEIIKQAECFDDLFKTFQF